MGEYKGLNVQPATLILLKLFDEGHDKIQRGERAPEELRHASDYLRTLGPHVRGLVIIDLLTLQQGQRTALLSLSLPVLGEGGDDGGTEGAVDSVPEGPVE